MDYFNARWYDPYLSQWTSADSIIPDLIVALSWNRYSYVYYNPINYLDSTGHAVTCDEDEDCKQSQRLSRLDEEHYWKELIKEEFGITMSNNGGKNWTIVNLRIAYSGLMNIKRRFDGNFNMDEAIFMLAEASGKCSNGGSYCGWTTGTTITFYTTTSQKIRYQNLYHEIGHVLDNLPGSKDQYSAALRKLEQSQPGFLSHEGFISQNSLKSFYVTEPNGAYSESLQHPSTDPAEQWADIFANYIAGNINLADAGGIQMYNFVTENLP